MQDIEALHLPIVHVVWVLQSLFNSTCTTETLLKFYVVVVCEMFNYMRCFLRKLSMINDYL